MNEIIQGDCLEVMKTFPDNHFSAIVTDPPYGLHFMGKDWDKFKKTNFDEKPDKHFTASRGMVRDIRCANSAAGEYDPKRNDEFQSFIQRVSSESLRIVKPGGHLLMFGAPRRYHRQICAIEDAGWEIRDCLMWIFGSGFPKSHNHFGLEGYGTALKPAYEPIIMAMKPLDGTFKQNAEKWGQAGINIDGCRIEGKWNSVSPNKGGRSAGIMGKKTMHPGGECHSKGRWPANVIFDDFFEQILVLKDSLPNDIISVIQEYFHDYKLPNLQKRNKHISEPNQKEQSTVLQSPLLQSCFDGKDERGSSPYEGSETSTGINCSDEKTTDQNWQRESSLQGILVRERVQVHQSSSVAQRTSGNSETNDEEKRPSRTSVNNGGLFESSIEKIGDCSSSQRSEGRQQDREFGSDGQLNSQNGTPGHFERIERVENGKRTIKVLACDVPEQWLKYFVNSGQQIRSPNCAAAMLDQQSGKVEKHHAHSGKDKGIYGKIKGGLEFETYGDSGGASRFFYCAKASSRERNEGLPNGQRSTHPTVKPLALMRYLIKLVMPPQNGLLLDPFAGSGSTILAAKQLGISAIGIEKQEDYAEIARARLNFAEGSGNDEKQMEIFA